MEQNTVFPAEGDLTAFSIGDPAVQACPYGYYRAMQRTAPVHYDAQTDLWMIADYSLVVEVLSNWQTFSSGIDMRRQVGGPDSTASDRLFAAKGYVVTDVLSQVDPPRHTFYRSLVERLFTAPVVKRMTDYLETHTHELIDGFIERGQCDFFAEFAVPLPLGVIADQLGVPKADMPQFKAWTDAIIETVGLMLSAERKLECTRQIIAFQHYFVTRMAEKRAAPSHDILSGLVAARHPDGRALTAEETLALIQQLLVAGNETTRNHLAAGLLLLIQHPDLQVRLRADPRLIATFVEESLRLESPVQGLFRIAVQATTLGGVEIPKGAKIYVTYAAGNRDDKMFPDADRLDIGRTNTTRHLAFSYGIHRCVGQMLARKELEIAFRALLSRLIDIELTPGQDPIGHVPSYILRALKGLKITFGKV